LVACLLFALKLYFLRAYAAFEVIFAVAMSAASMYRMKDQVEYIDLLGMMASCYLIIRGLDNFKKGMDEHKAALEGQAVSNGTLAATRKAREKAVFGGGT
jgi:hypothetical protein